MCAHAAAVVSVQQNCQRPPQNKQSCVLRGRRLKPLHKSTSTKNHDGPWTKPDAHMQGHVKVCCCAKTQAQGTLQLDKPLLPTCTLCRMQCGARCSACCQQHSTAASTPNSAEQTPLLHASSLGSQATHRLSLLRSQTTCFHLGTLEATTCCCSTSVCPAPRHRRTPAHTNARTGAHRRSLSGVFLAQQALPLPAMTTAIAL